MYFIINKSFLKRIINFLYDQKDQQVFCKLKIIILNKKFHFKSHFSKMPIIYIIY